MAFLQLQGIGKIYVSEGNVTVGIRGVDLSFERGEFVAITGRSGSGKSTLLNVISGMDTYEEGELLIEGNPTSHYRQPDWEKYREKYISFVFQDYNIIDSYTVLENVELALMHIPDRRERRRRAIELLDRVGDFIKRYEDIGDKLQKVQQAYDNTRKKLDGHQSILVPARELRKLGAKENPLRPIPNMREEEETDSE